MLYNQQEEHSTHPHKGSGALESPPQKSSTKVTHKKRQEITQKQSFMTITTNRTSLRVTQITPQNNAISYIFQHTKHKLRATDHTNSYICHSL